MQTILITTSGIGSRLGNLTKFLNKSLIRVGNKFSICYIIDKYDIKNTQFVITLGYLGHLVKEFLNIAYKNNNFIFIEVDNYDREGSSLVYSLLQAKNALQCPFTFYCCDSITLDNININNIKHNILYVAESDDGSSYASINIDKNKVLNINPKGENRFDYVYTGISYIYDYSEYWKNLEALYLEQSNNKELSDIHVISLLLNKENIFEYKILSKWYDIGNTKCFNIAINNIKCNYDVLYKDTESICFLDDKVIKFMHDKNNINNRVIRGKTLYPNAAKILDYSEHFFSMEYVEGIVFSKNYIYGNIYKLLNWAYDNLWINKIVDSKYIDICNKFYYEKTKDRIKQLNHYDYANINGINILSINELLNKVDWNFLYTDTFYQFHGDFILDNIICNTDGLYKLIDWRQDFGGEISHGDMYYDLAKLRHNIIFNHANISNNLYKIEIENDSILVDLKCNYFLIQQLEDYDRFIIEKGLNLKKIKILTALIWLNMSPLHEYNVSKLLFYFGKYNLALALGDYTLP